MPSLRNTLTGGVVYPNMDRLMGVAGLGGRARVGVLALGASLAAACVVQVDSPYQMIEQQRFEVSGVPDIDLTTFDGAIEVRGWSRSEVFVEVEKTGSTQELVEAIQVVAEQDGNRIRVEVQRPVGTWTTGILAGPSRRAKIVASVPLASNVVLNSGDGAIAIERVEGRLDLRTGDGSVRGIDLKGEVRVHTADGSVRLDAIEGRCDVSTDDGSVTLGGALQAVRARSRDGSITIRAEGGSRMADDWDVNTSNGRVVLYLPDGFDATLDLLTGDGRIRADVNGLAPPPSTRDRRGGQLRGTLGGGGYSLIVRTDDGSISVRPS